MLTVRKNVLSLSDDEIDRLVAGFKAMKAKNTYDPFIISHYQAFAWVSLDGTSVNSAHMGPAFLPWHRAFLFDFEYRLQQAMDDFTFGLPYWDWTDSRSVWTDNLMGGEGVPVISGPFTPSQWSTIDENGRETDGLVRVFGHDDWKNLPTMTDVQRLFYYSIYDTPPYTTTSRNSFRNALEGYSSKPFDPSDLETIRTITHNLVHAWVGGPGGQMSEVRIAPNDPIFFLHHCNVDRIWAQWQSIHPTSSYLPINGGPEGHNLDDFMFPWNAGKMTRKPSEMLSPRELGYSYDEYYTIRTLEIIVKTGDKTFSDASTQVDIMLAPPRESRDSPWKATLDGGSCDQRFPFQIGQTDTFTFNDVRQDGTALPAVLFTRLIIGRPAGQYWFGEWNVTGITIVADGLTLYDKRMDMVLSNRRTRFDADLITDFEPL